MRPRPLLTPLGAAIESQRITLWREERAPQKTKALKSARTGRGGGRGVAAVAAVGRVDLLADPAELRAARQALLDPVLPAAVAAAAHVRAGAVLLERHAAVGAGLDPVGVLPLGGLSRIENRHVEDERISAPLSSRRAPLARS